MKIVLLSTSDHAGGAAIACLRLANALSAFGHEVTVLVVDKKSSDPMVLEVASARRSIDHLLKNLQYAFNKRMLVAKGHAFSSDPWWGHNIQLHPAIQDADIINLHWINHGFLGMKSLKSIFSLKKPVIWHMHDFWPFTGGCHYPTVCRNFEKACGHCIALKNSAANDLSKQQWLQKQLLFTINPPTLVGASAWLTNEANQSALVRNTNAKAIHIPNPIDTAVYTPEGRDIAKSTLGLASNKKYLLFAAMNATDPRKGLPQLQEAIQMLSRDTSSNIELLIAGKAHESLVNQFPLKAHLLGGLNQMGMRDAYRAADAFVIPSLEDNLPNTVLESLACGTPVTGFHIGGIPEMVKSGKNGHLAPANDSAELARAIDATLNLPVSAVEIAGSIIEYQPIQVAQKYTRLFLEMIQKE